MAMTATLRMPGRRVEFRVPRRRLGDFFALSLDILVTMVRKPFAWREFVTQCWFVARVTIVPALALSVPLNAFVTYMLNVLLIEIGAGDIAGAAVGLSVVQGIGPFASVFVISGAACTAMCADLGARTIREELDAMRVMGIDPVQSLLVPRVVAVTLTSFLLSGVTTIAGIAGSYLFTIYVQNGTPGPFATSLTLLIGLRVVILVISQTILFGLVAGLVTCYKGITVSGGPQGVGNAVNETVIYVFMALFVIDMLTQLIIAKSVF